MVVSRIDGELPQNVRTVTRVLQFVFGGLFLIAATFVVAGGASVVLMPILMGREGVGTAMITLTLVCVSIVLSGILLLATRSASRVLQREKLALRTLSGFSTTALVASVLLLAIAQWVHAAFFTSDVSGEGSSFDWSIVVRLAAAVAIAIFLWATVVLRTFAPQQTD